MGSSFLPGELIAAFLWAQLEEADQITKERLARWQRYHELLAPLEAKGILRRPIIPDECEHNAHMYFVILAPLIDRLAVLNALKQNKINALFHYVPLHSSPGGIRYGQAHGDLEVTVRNSERLVRLPLWVGITDDEQCRVVEVLRQAVS